MNTDTGDGFLDAVNSHAGNLELRLLDRLEDLCERLGRSEDGSEPDEFKIAGGEGLHVHLGDDSKRGSWSQKGGDQQSGRSLVKLIKLVLEPDEGARVWAENWLTEEAGQPLPARTSSRRHEGEANQIGRARLHWSQADRILAPAGLAYLASRGLVAARWPATMRWARGAHHGLIFAGLRLGEDWPHCVQWIYLDDAGAKRQQGDIGKRSLGPRRGAPVCFSGRDRLTIQHAEGPENALTAWLATGETSYAWLGGIPDNFATVQPGARHVLVADDDGPGRGVAALMRRARLAALGGIEVAVATPLPDVGQLKADFNDLAQCGTILTPDDPLFYARARLLAARDLAGGGSEPETLILPLERAQAAILPAMLAWRRETDAWRAACQEAANDPGRPDPGPAPKWAMQLEMGLGKTEQGLRLAVHLVAEGERGLVFTVPTYRLAGQIEARGLAMGLDCRVYRSRIGSDRAMCANGDAVRRAQEEGETDIQGRLCQDASGNTCRHFATCPYQEQRLALPAVWIVTTERWLSGDLSEIGPIRWTVLDEGIANARMSYNARLLPADFLDALERQAGDDAPRFAVLVPKIRQALARLSWTRALEVMAAVSISDLKDFTRRLAGLRRDIGVRPNMTAADIEAARIAADVPPRWNANLTTLILLCVELLPVASGKRLESGRIRRHEAGWELHLPPRLRAECDGPALILDATLDVEMTRAIFPAVRVLPAILTDSPHVTYRQDVRFANGKRALMRPAIRRDRIFPILLERECSTLLIAQKEIIALFQGDGLPDWIETLHYNATRGIDDFGHVARLITLGCPTPTVRSTETIAGALDGARILDPLDDGAGFPRRPVQVGQLGVVMQAYHPNPTVEAVRSAVMVAEVVQAIGRARGCRRTAATPLEVVMLGQIITPYSYRAIAV